MRTLLLASLLSFLMAIAAVAEEKKEETAAAPKETKPAPEEVRIDDLEQDYWRPNKEELEVVQNRRFEKKGRFELGLHYGAYQGQDYMNTHAYGISATYNLSNEWFVEASYLKLDNTANDFLRSVQQRYGFTPDFNVEKRQYALSVAWVPIYAKFSLLGKKISHFEMYVAPGVGVTETAQNHLTGLFTVGQKFFVTENFLLRIEWRIAKYTDRIATTQGATSIANGGPGYVDQSETKHDIIFGIGWMFP